MKEFFKMFLASFLAGAILIFAGFLFFVLILALLPSSKSSVAVAENSVLRIELSNGIADNPNDFQFNFAIFGGVQGKPYKLIDAIQAVENAAEDDRITALYLDFNYGSFPAGFAQIQEFRNALLKFKETEKPIIAYGNVYTQRGYYLASLADSVFLNPNGVVEWVGLSRTYTFYKDAFEKIGVKPVVLRPKNNQFKSAVEPYFLSEMSEPNRMQLTQYLEGTWTQIASSVASDRGFSSAQLEDYANRFATLNANNCLELGFVDGLRYDDEVLSLLRELTNTDAAKKPNTVSLSDYIKAAKSDWMPIGSDVIAVVYAEGEIIDGEGSTEQIGGNRFVNAIRKARENAKVKAMVVRINSPGGSAFASDLIWREIQLAQEKMPVVVSMGNVAASGGYYIAAPADTILVNPFTVTGSIGVFGVFFTGEELIQNKMGLKYDGVKTHELAELGALYRDISPSELELLENNVTATYGKFLSRVANGRGLDSLYIDSIGQGRIWLGQPAIDNGLADGMGGLVDAIAVAKKLGGIEDDKYRVADYPEPIDPIQQILKSFNMETQMEKRLEKTFGKQYQDLKNFENILQQRGVQARLEWDILE